MDWLQFLAEVVKAGAWPLAVVVVARWFRPEIGELIGRVKSFEGPAKFKVEFTEKVTHVAETVKALLLPGVTSEVQGFNPVKFGTPTASLGERPSALVFDSWKRIEEALMDILTFTSSSGDKPVSANEPLEWIWRLRDRGYLEDELLGALLQLLSLRNEVAHRPQFEPDEAAAREYYETATKVAYQLETKLAGIHENAPRD